MQAYYDAVLADIAAAQDSDDGRVPMVHYEIIEDPVMDVTVDPRVKDGVA